MDEAAEVCELLTWDTAFWGFPIARVRGQKLADSSQAAVDAWCVERGVRCLYVLTRADDAASVATAEACGYHLVDVRITLDRRLREGEHFGHSDDGGVAVRAARPSDVAPLEAIAREIHRDTRFYYDHRFPRTDCDRLYGTWIRQSCEGYADRVLVGDAGHGPIGYVTCHQDGVAEGRIGLLGVEAPASGRGVGRALVRAALHWFFDERRLKIVSVVTQARNVGAQRLYQGCGFRTAAVGLWYHRWYEAREARDS